MAVPIDAQHAAMAENWARADARWRAFDGRVKAPRYEGYGATRREMLALVTVAERAEILEKKRDGKGLLRIGNDLGLPYAVVGAVVKEAQGAAAGEAKALRAKKVPESPRDWFELVQERLLKELDRRTDKTEKLKGLSTEELGAMLKTCRENLATIANMEPSQPGEMKVVARMPMDEEGE